MLNKIIIHSFACALALMSFNLQAADNYVGIGVGQSMFDPDGVTLDDDKDTAMAIFLGRDFNANISGEIYYHDLGSAVFAGEDIDVSTLGISGLYHWHNNVDPWSIYVRAGATQISTGSAPGVESDDKIRVGYGLGLRWNVKENWFSRLEYRGYGSETSAIFLTAALKFGGSSSSGNDTSSSDSMQEEAMQEEPMTEASEAADTMADEDGDGIADANDKCPGTSAGANIDSNGCPVVITSEEKKEILSKIDLKGINFKSNSKELTSDSLATLDAAAEVLAKNSTIKLEVQAYSDSMGDANYNLNLSNQRAETVKNYLVGKGIDGSRLDSKGYGEENPIADNSTAEGRAKNRRVEFKVVE